MRRYQESLAALTVALDLMMKEGDTLMIAAIAHPLQLIGRHLAGQHATVVPIRPRPGGLPRE